MQLMRMVSPKVSQILFDERDEYLCHSILQAKGKRIVAVVGMDGIEREWNKKNFR